MGTGSFPGVKCGGGVLLTTHPLLVSRSWKSRTIPLPTLWATGTLYLYLILLSYRLRKVPQTKKQRNIRNRKDERVDSKNGRQKQRMDIENTVH